jgi:CheY-like chemotaxis protein
MVREILTSAGAEVDEVDDGDAAVEKVMADRFDAVLMDVRMPRLDGLEATRRLRAAGVRVPIVAFTADAVAEHRSECIASGCDGYIAKPVDRDDLLRAVHAHVRGAAA